MAHGWPAPPGERCFGRSRTFQGPRSSIWGDQAVFDICSAVAPIRSVRPPPGKAAVTSGRGYHAPQRRLGRRECPFQNEHRLDCLHPVGCDRRRRRAWDGGRRADPGQRPDCRNQRHRRRAAEAPDGRCRLAACVRRRSSAVAARLFRVRGSAAPRSFRYNLRIGTIPSGYPWRCGRLPSWWRRY